MAITLRRQIFAEHRAIEEAKEKVKKEQELRVQKEELKAKKEAERIAFLESFKNKPGASSVVSAPQFGKGVRLATSDGERVTADVGTFEAPKQLVTGFLHASYGYWKTDDDVVFRCWSHDSIWFAKIVSYFQKMNLLG